MRFSLEDVTIDFPRMQIDRGGVPIPAEPQVFDVIRYLIEHRDRVVLKTELLDEIWGNRFVSESALSSRIKSARQVLGDNGHDQRLIRTVHGRGFRFVGDVQAAPEVQTAPAPAAGLALAERLIGELREGHGAAVALRCGVGGAEARSAFDLLIRDGQVNGWLTGRANAGAGLLPFAGLIRAFQDLVESDPGLLAALPRAASSEITAWFEHSLPSSPQRLFVAVTELISEACRRSGAAILVVTDLHLADSGTIDVLRFLAVSCSRLPFVLAVEHPHGFDAGGEFRVFDVDNPERLTGQPAESNVPASIRELMRCAATIGNRFEEADLAAVASENSAAELRRGLDVATASGVLSFEDGSFRFIDHVLFETLRAEVPRHRQRDIHTLVAGALIERDGAADRIARHLIAAGEDARAAAYALSAAREAADAQMHAQVVRWTGLAIGHVSGRERCDGLCLRARALLGMGDVSGIGLYREALATADDDLAPRIRAELARALMLAGDIDGAAQMLEGLEPTGGPADGAILFATAMLNYFRGDLDAAERVLETAVPFALKPHAPARMLDLITLQGLIAHNRGRWFDRLRRELAFSGDNPELASTLFEAHICVAQYVVYGPTPRSETLNLAENLARTAARTGSRPALAFARTLAGDVGLLAGDLDGARRFFGEALELYREMRAETGEAHVLQRLAEVALAAGDRGLAESSARQALALARWSPMSHHLLQRTFGTLLSAAGSTEAGLRLAREAQSTLDEPGACPFCEIMVAVPLAMAFAAAGEFDAARRNIEAAERSASLWQGESWLAAVTEARACLAAAEGDWPQAAALFREAAHRFERAEQPLDVARCLAAIVS